MIAGYFNARCRQTGVALLTVMFILVLLSTLSVYMIEDEHLALRRVSNMREAEQGFQLAISSETWVTNVLREDANKTKHDHLGEPWNHLEKTFSGNGEMVLEGDGQIAAPVVVDQQSRFNLNNLLEQVKKDSERIWLRPFKNLLRLLELDEGLADAVIDWIDGGFYTAWR